MERIYGSEDTGIRRENLDTEGLSKTSLGRSDIVEILKLFFRSFLLPHGTAMKRALFIYLFILT